MASSVKYGGIRQNFSYSGKAEPYYHVAFTIMYSPGSFSCSVVVTSEVVGSVTTTSQSLSLSWRLVARLVNSWVSEVWLRDSEQYTLLEKFWSISLYM